MTVDVFQVSKGRRVVGQRLVARFANRSRSIRWNGRANRAHRLRLRPRGLARGDYRVRLTARSGSERVCSALVSRRL